MILISQFLTRTTRRVRCVGPDWFQAATKHLWWLIIPARILPGYKYAVCQNAKSHQLHRHSSTDNQISPADTIRNIIDYTFLQIGSAYILQCTHVYTVGELLMTTPGVSLNCAFHECISQTSHTSQFVWLKSNDSYRASAYIHNIIIISVVRPLRVTRAVLSQSNRAMWL